MTNEQPKLTHAERGRLGGLTTAMRPHAHEEAVARGKKGGSANVEKNGRLALIKANHMRNGKIPRGPIVNQ